MSRKCTIGNINELSSLANKFVVDKIKERGLPILKSHIPLFYILSEDGEAMLFNELASEWIISKSSLSDILSRYEKLGMVKRITCCEDKRNVFVNLTDKGLEVQKTLDIIEREFLDILLKGFKDEKKKGLFNDIDMCLRNIKENRL